MTALVIVLGIILISTAISDAYKARLRHKLELEKLRLEHEKVEQKYLLD